MDVMIKKLMNIVFLMFIVIGFSGCFGKYANRPELDKLRCPPDSFVNHYHATCCNMSEEYLDHEIKICRPLFSPSDNKTHVCCIVLRNLTEEDRIFQQPCLFNLGFFTWKEKCAAVTTNRDQISTISQESDKQSSVGSTNEPSPASTGSKDCMSAQYTTFQHVLLIVLGAFILENLALVIFAIWKWWPKIKEKAKRINRFIFGQTAEEGNQNLAPNASSPANMPAPVVIEIEDNSNIASSPTNMPVPVVNGIEDNINTDIVPTQTMGNAKPKEPETNVDNDCVAQPSPRRYTCVLHRTNQQSAVNNGSNEENVPLMINLKSQNEEPAVASTTALSVPMEQNQPGQNEETNRAALIGPTTDGTTNAQVSQSELCAQNNQSDARSFLFGLPTDGSLSSE